MCIKLTWHQYNIEVIIFFIRNSQVCLYVTQSNSDRLFITQSTVLQADWLILGDKENATLHITMPCWQINYFLEYFLC